MLYARWSKGRAFGESSDQLVQEFFCADLKVKGIAAIFDANVQELERKYESAIVYSLSFPCREHRIRPLPWTYRKC